MISYIKQCWLRISLRKKLGSFSILIILIMGISFGFILWLVNFSMSGFFVILDDNSRCYQFQEAMDLEIEAFESFIREQSKENREAYNQACTRTEKCISELPYDYRQIGSERYARTWNIKNGYESYQRFRDEFTKISAFDTYFIPSLYQVYDMQSYLQTYARRLVQATLTEGMERYQGTAKLFHWTPYLMFAFSAGMVGTATLLTQLLARTVLAPLVMLVQSSRKIEKNDFSGKDLCVANQDEMGELVLAFNKMKHATEGYINTLKANNEMAEQLHKDEMEKIEMEKELNAAKLEFLKSQINPHFLFNTLNMIASMASLEDAAVTEKMIASMSNLFRYNLKTEEQIVPLEQEIKVAKDYIYIQQMRFGNRIRYGSSLEVDITSVRIPSFTLQPLVENAIVHGLSKKEQGGLLFLRIWKVGEAVRISVADNGLGMEAEKWQQLEKALKEHATGKVGIGLGNIYQRIHAIYHEGDMKVYSQEGKGTVVQLTIPQDAEEV